MTRVILNADDLGASQEVNEATFVLMTQGLVTSATLLANAPCTDDAIARLHHFPQCSFGVHLNITQYRPLSGAHGLAPVLDAEGNMVRQPRLPLDRDFLSAVYRELCAQIGRLLQSGVRLSHIDSHHHVHTIPALFPVLKAVQRRFGIRKVRLSKNLYCESSLRRGLLFKKELYNRCLRRLYATRTTAKFCEFSTFASVLRRLRSVSVDSIELMLHPGSSREDYRQEIRDLQDMWAQHWVRLFEPANYFQI